MKIRSFLVLSAVMLALILADTATADCTFLGLGNSSDRLTCGTLKVPEDHDAPKGRKIRISYVIVSAKASNPKRQAVIYFTGGPGGGSINPGFIGFLGNSQIAEHRDIIIFDQRGIHYSSALPDIGKGVYAAMAADTDMGGERRMIAKVLAEYRKRADEKGIDLGAYNSVQNARDVIALMKKLRYRKYNLFGSSYGTRLARIIEDRVPQMLNTVILDSPNLMTDDFLIDRMKSYSEAAGKTFQACERDPNCQTANRDLENKYVAVIEKLKQKPVAVKYDGGTFYINSQDAMYFLRRQLYKTDALIRFPAMLEALDTGDQKILGQAVANELADINDGSFNTSMFLAVSAYESMDRANTPEVIDQKYKELPYFPDQLAFFTNLYIEGMDWGGKHIPAKDRVFKMSAVPTLIFVNQYDPVTPPENGVLFQKQLSHSQLFIIDQGGHGGGNFACKFALIEAFMDDPSRKLVANCMKLASDD